MKILIAVTTDIYFDQRIIKIATALVRNGYEVSVVGRKKENVMNADRFEFKAHWISCFFKRSALFYAEYNIRLFFYLLFHKADIICACDLDTLLGSCLAASLKKSRLVFDAHEYFEESVEIIHKRPIQKIWEGIAYTCIPKTCARYTVSASLAHVLSEKYRYPFQVVRNIPDTVLGNCYKSRNHRLLWYQGAVNKGRGLELVIQSLLQLPEYSLGIAGDGDLLHDLRRMVQQHQLESRVTFYGRLDRMKLNEKAHEAWIGLDLLSDSSASYFYSLSNKTFDYMHAGLPMIQMDFPEYRALHAQFQMGILLSSLDVNALVHAIRKMEDQAFHEHCQQACRAASAAINWTDEVKILLACYREIRA